MGGFSISGLSSGLDTAGIINQLLAIERAPQQRLQSRRADIQNTVSSYQELNTRFNTLEEAADDLSSALDWVSRKATSSDEDVVSATVTGAPVNGSLAFEVTALAASHTVISDNTVAGTDTIVADGSDFTVNGVTITAADYGGGSLAEVVDAINAADAGVTASAVQVSPGNYRLQLAAEDSGADGTFTVGGTGLTTALGAFGIVTQGSDAQITVGDGPAAYTVSSATNEFADVLPGLTFTAHTLGSATVTVENDGEALADKVEAMVTAMNEVSRYVLDRSDYDADSGVTGVFLGQSLPSNLRTDMVDALIDPVSGSGLVGASVGIELDRDGNISFDRDAFLEAYAEDPDAVEAFFATNDTATEADDGIAERLALMANEATAVNTGRIAVAIEGRETEIDTLDARIENWDVRLQLRETNLRRYWTNLETTLSQLQSQGNWLSGQIASLPQASSS